MMFVSTLNSAKPARSYYFVLFGIGVSFFGKCLYYATFIKEGIPPDESMHLAVINEFAKEFKFFVDPDNFTPGYGGVTSQDRFLYHFLMANTAGKIQLFSSSLLNYRFFNILISLANVYIFYRILGQIFKDRISIIIGLTFYTNILMFSILSSSVSYDNFTNLLSVGIIYLVICAAKKTSIIYHTGIIVLLLFGFITKPSCWPLFVPYSFLLLKDLGNVYTNYPLFGCSEVFDARKYYKYLVMFVLLIVSGVMATSVAYRNYSQYGKIAKLSCQRIYGLDLCREQDELGKVYQIIRDRNRNNDRLGVIDYYDDWIDLILKRTFGFFGERIMIPSKIESQFIKMVMAIFLMGFIFRLREANFDIKICAGIAIFYTLIVFSYVNYKSYLNHGQFDAGVHGRYLFPILSCTVILITYVLYDSWKSKRNSSIIVIPVLILFIWLDYPSFIRDIQKPLMAEEYVVNYAQMDLKEAVSDGMKVTLDSYNGVLIMDDESLIRIADDTEDIVFKGWAIDQRESRPGSNLVFKINQDKLIVANYGFERKDVAEAYGSTNLINSGFSVVIPISDLDQSENEIEILLINDKGNYITNTRRFKIQI